MIVSEAPPPVKRNEAVLPAEPREPPAFEGLENRTPLISKFAIGMEVEEANGQTLAVPPLEIKNELATQHTLQIPPNASSITIDFPLRMLYRQNKSKVDENQVKKEAAIDPASANGDAETPAKPAQSQTNGTANGGKRETSLTWPWQPELYFNGRQTQGSWTSAELSIDPALLEDASTDYQDDERFATRISYSYCRVRLLPRRGINVFEITVKPDSAYPPISKVPLERYLIYFC